MKKALSGAAPYALNIALPIALTFAPLAMTGCGSTYKVEVAPVEVKPIHITIDVNVKVDKDLDDFFGDIDEKAAEHREAGDES